MADKWNDWYKDLKIEDCGSFRYGETKTYNLGYEFLKDCNKIEDWGCGAGGFKRFFVNDSNKYIGVDGSKTPFADIKVELINYVSEVEGIYMRHVLEHNYEWKVILENACKSFTKKMCLVLFTPFSDKTIEIAHNLNHGVDVPDLSFNKNELIEIFEKYDITFELKTINTDTGYGIEHIFYLNKKCLNLIFYTCFYGSNDNPAYMINQAPSLKYKCYYYTNNMCIIEKLKETTWIGIYDNKSIYNDLIESCMVAKHIKTMPHEYSELKDCDYLCYIDSKMEIDDNYVEYHINKYNNEGNFSLLLKKHYFIHSNNIWDEYNESMKQHRYILQNEKYKKYINKQINNGLSEITEYHYACGFLIRNMKHEKIIEINKTWYEHIQECGIQDQISFFFVKQLFNGHIYPLE